MSIVGRKYICQMTNMNHISKQIIRVPEANTDDIKAAFIKYEEEFYIPPQDALRSIIRRFREQGPKKRKEVHNKPDKRKSSLTFYLLQPTEMLS